MKPGTDYTGVGVGAFILDPTRTKVLLLKRKKEPGAGLWSIPGGALEFGESFEDAVVREIKEETNLDIEVVELLSLTNAYNPVSKVHWIAPQYLSTVKGGELRHMEPEKHEALEWVALDSVPDNLTIESKNALRRYLLINQ